MKKIPVYLGRFLSKHDIFNPKFELRRTLGLWHRISSKVKMGLIIVSNTNCVIISKESSQVLYFLSLV